MTDIIIDAGTLEFSDADLTATGLLVPFHEECASNLGKFTVDSDSFTLPADLTGMSLNVEHKREDVVGGFTKAWTQDTGIFGSFKYANTPEGRAAFEEGKSGKRKHLSAEVSGVVIKAGKAIAGKVFAAAQVTRPAFPSATLLAAAVDTPADFEEEVVSTYTDADGYTYKTTRSTSVTTEENKTTETTTVVTETEPVEDPDEEKEDAVGNATVPNTLAASVPASTGQLTLKDVGQLMFAAHNGEIGIDELGERLSGQNGATLFGALSDVKYDGTGGLAPVMTQPQWIGEVAKLSTYVQQILPLFAHADLTSLTINGFKWTQKADGGDWAGNKAAVPSNTLTVAAVTASAVRWAVGHDIAREFVDFSVPGFFESYAVAVLESYLRWADAKVGAAILAGATVVTADALTTLPGVAGGTIGSAASAIIDGASALVTAGITPTFALLAPALWKQMAKMPESNVLGYLNASLGLSEGDMDGFIMRPSASITTGKVLVGARGAATVYELPGNPVRIDALDLARGGVDKAAFGYLGVNINDATGLALVTAATS